MDEDLRTVWCGNLSEKVSEDVLYELFLQGGPVQKVSIPKDRDGKQRTYGFITYKHADSVRYALNLFDGTALYDRPLSMKTRNNIEPQPQIQIHPQNMLHQNHMQNYNNMIQLGNQMVLSYESLVPDLPMQMCGLYAAPGMVMYPTHNQGNHYAGNSERRTMPGHPYQRDRERDRHDHHRDHRDRHSSHRSNDFSRHNDHRSSRRNYR